MIIETLIKKSSLSRQRLEWLQRHASHLYKVYEIDKGGTSKGKREICQPTKELKIIQRWLIKRYVSKLPVSEAATAYSCGRQPAENKPNRIHSREAATATESRNG